jgi:hypothetical protein
VVPEPEPAALGDGTEGGGDGLAARQLGQSRRRRWHDHPRAGATPGGGQLPQGAQRGVAPPRLVQAHGRRRQAERGQLVLAQPRIGELVALTGYPVPGLIVTALVVEALGDERHAHLAQHVLVPLEVAAEGVGIVGVAADPAAELFPGEGTVGVDEGGDQVDETLEAVHGGVAAQLRARR